MKRTSINALCIIIIAILATNVLTVSWAGVEGFLTGWNAVEEDTPAIPLHVTIAQRTSPSLCPNDSITLDDGTQYPVFLKRAVLLVPDRDDLLVGEVINSLCFVVQFVLLVLLIVQFAKFIININKGLIFEYVNIRHLRRFGIYLLIIALLQCVAGLYNDYSLARLGLTRDGALLTSVWSIPWSDLLFGCLALLMAQIWTRGLKMREEQELTI